MLCLKGTKWSGTNISVVITGSSQLRNRLCCLIAGLCATVGRRGPGCTHWRFAAPVAALLPTLVFLFRSGHLAAYELFPCTGQLVLLYMQKKALAKCCLYQQELV